MVLQFDYEKLRGKIKEMFGSQRNLAKALGVSEKTLSLKLMNKGSFSQGEIVKILFLLRIDPVWAKEYFFTFKV